MITSVRFIGFIFLFGLFSANSAQAAKFVLDKAHTSVDFKIKHLVVSSVSGKYRDFEGSFDFDEKTGKVKDLNVKIKADSIDTGEPKRDEHLRSKDFFEVEKYPSLEFKADSAEVKKGKSTKVKGNLTIHGVTKPVILDVTFNGKVKDPWGNEKMGFDATTKINRKDFGLTWNKALEAGGVVVGDDVNISISGEANAEQTKK